MAVYKAKEEKWTKDGRKWFFVASYKTSDGKRKKFHSRKYFTRMDAYDEERTFLLSRNPQKIDKYITFKELYGLFYEYKQDKVKAATKLTYRNRIKYFKQFYDLRINQITYEKYSIWRIEMENMKLSIRTKNDIQKLFKTILNYGSKWYNYDFKDLYNKIESFNDPDAVPKEMDYYTLEEFKQFISVEEDLKWRCIFKVLYYCGLRMGELRGLTWDSIDLINKTLRVNKNVVCVKNKNKSYTLTSPKTKKSIRTLPLSDHMLNDLIKYKNECKKTYRFNEEWYVFGNIDPISSSTVRERKKRNAELAKIKEIRIHDFRHSCVSLLINSGANITLVASYMGHTKVDETLNTYAHFYRNTLEGIVKIMDECQSDDDINNL